MNILEIIMHTDDDVLNDFLDTLSDNDRELFHYGVLGMRWGFSKGKSNGGNKASDAKTKTKTNISDKNNPKNKTVEKPKTKSVKDMSDNELRDKISRLNLEKQYIQLNRELSPSQKSKSSKAKKVISDILLQSTKNVGGQIANYAIGTAVNKALKAQVVNVKDINKNKKD